MSTILSVPVERTFYPGTCWGIGRLSFRDLAVFEFINIILYSYLSIHPILLRHNIKQKYLILPITMSEIGKSVVRCFLVWILRSLIYDENF